MPQATHDWSPLPSGGAIHSPSACAAIIGPWSVVSVFETRAGVRGLSAPGSGKAWGGGLAACVEGGDLCGGRMGNGRMEGEIGIAGRYVEEGGDRDEDGDEMIE